jgi:hypothetical protein
MTAASPDPNTWPTAAAIPAGAIRGLWLVPNIARSGDAVTGRPAAGLVDQLTDGLLITNTVRETLTAIEESAAARLRLVVGAPGSGKSTLLAVMIRPKLVDTLNLRDGYIKAAVFLDNNLHPGIDRRRAHRPVKRDAARFPRGGSVGGQRG